jgi:hypothetical protein
MLIRRSGGPKSAMELPSSTLASLPAYVEHARHRLVNIAMIRYCGSGMIGLCGEIAITSHPQSQLHKSEPPGCNRWPLPCSRQSISQRSERVAISTSIACKSFSAFGDLLFCMRRVPTKGRAELLPRSFDDGRTVYFRHLETSYFGSYDGSVGLAAQEGRDIENVFLDRIARRRGAAVRIEALRSRMARVFRNRLCRSPFGVAGRRAERRTL